VDFHCSRIESTRTSSLFSSSIPNRPYLVRVTGETLPSLESVPVREISLRKVKALTFVR